MYMASYMERNMTKQKKKKSHVRDTWIPESWRYNGKGFQKDKSKESERKRKYKKNYMDEVDE